MRTLLFLLQKEFRQIFRNPAIVRMILVAPTLQLLVLPLAADYEVKNINLAVIDHDHSTWSRQLTQKFAASDHFQLVGYEDSYRHAFALVEKNEADILLELPSGFERDLIREGEGKVMMSANAVNGVKGGLGTAYALNIIGSFNK
ncbi:MAG: ABC transporter permease, partial [Candidatus Kapaibacterium sp.]